MKRAVRATAAGWLRAAALACSTPMGPGRSSRPASLHGYRVVRDVRLPGDTELLAYPGGLREGVPRGRIESLAPDGRVPAARRRPRTKMKYSAGYLRYYRQMKWTGGTSDRIRGR